MNRSTEADMADAEKASDTAWEDDADGDGSPQRESELLDGDLGSQDGQSEQGNVKPRNRRGSAIVAAIVCILLIIIVLGASLGSRRKSDSVSDELSLSTKGPSNAPTNDPSGKPTNSPSGAPTNAPSGAPTSCVPETRGRARDLEPSEEYESIGCFLAQDSPDKNVLFSSGEERVSECSGICITRYFGIVSDTCYCYAEAPDSRLAIGDCRFACGVEQSQRMESYFNKNLNPVCNVENTEAVRNFLVEEDNVNFGFDVVSNTFRLSPFELYKDECGTNIYEVQTQFSSDSKSLQTYVEDVEEFANSRRDERSESIEASASLGYNGAMVAASVKVSAAFDEEQRNVFESSGANSQGSKVFTSLGVKRVVEVILNDFPSKNHFVTFSEGFASRLREYRDNGYQKQHAYQIIQTHGQFVLTRGVFGGYMQLRTTVEKQSFDSMFESEDQAKRCYEVAVKVEASGYGFEGSGEVGADGCTETEQSELRNLKSQYESQTSEQSIVGGTSENEDFVVTAQTSTLLKTKDKYPANDNGIELRLLSDFLSPEKVSPLEVRRHFISEFDFAEIQVNMENHTLEYLEEVGGILNECESCPGLKYLGEFRLGNDGVSFDGQCECYSPEDRTGVPTKAPSPMPSTIAPSPPPTTWLGKFPCSDPEMSICRNVEGGQDDFWRFGGDVEKITKIKVFAGNFWGNFVVSSMEVTYKLANGRPDETVTHGNGGDFQGEVTFDDTQYLTAIRGVRGRYIDNVRFKRNDLWLGVWGGKKDVDYNFACDQDSKVIQAFIVDSGSVVDDIGVHYQEC